MEIKLIKKQYTNLMNKSRFFEKKTENFKKNQISHMIAFQIDKTKLLAYLKTSLHTNN